MGKKGGERVERGEGKKGRQEKGERRREAK
jgi:hypothetical protein